MIKKNFRINPKYTIILKNNNSILCVPNDSGNIFKYNVEPNILEIEAINTILNNEIFLKSSSKIFKTLLSNKIIISNKYENIRDNTKLYLDTFLNINCDIKRLVNSKILLIGLGGIGSEIVNHLVGSGIRKYVLIDFDKVEESNFNRQYLFTLKDLGKNKTDVIEQVIKNKISNAEISKYNIKIQNDIDLLDIITKEGNVDFIVCSADTPFLDIRMCVLNSSKNTKIPCIFGGVGIFKGEFGPLFIKNNAKKKYYNDLLKYKNLVNNHNLNKASFGPTNTIISAFMAKDILLTLLNEPLKTLSLNKIIEIDFKNGWLNEKTQF